MVLKMCMEEIKLGKYEKNIWKNSQLSSLNLNEVFFTLQKTQTQ